MAQARPTRGGDVSRAMRLELADGRVLFVKHGPGLPHALHAAEAASLRWLAEAGTLRVPAVVAVGAPPGPPFLAIEMLALGRPAAHHDERLGRGLAALHAAGAPAFGAAHDGFIGPLPVPNDATSAWPEFLAERRLLPLAARAVADGAMDARLSRRIEDLCARLPDLTGPPEPPARLHGDLWSGNAVVLADGSPALVDPAAYGGHREVDLAMMRLFGGFSERVHAAYAEAAPLAEGWRERIPLMQVLPLLVHVVLFGGGYVSQLSAAVGRYAGGR